MDTSAVKSDSAMNSSLNQDVSIVANDKGKGRVEKEKVVDHQDLQTKAKNIDDDKERGSYNCSRCGVPKKGHVCPYQPKTKSKKRKKKKPPKRTHHDLIHIKHPTNNISNSKKVRDKRVLSGGDTDATMKKKAGAQKRPRTSKIPSTNESQKSVKDFLSKAVSSVVDTVASEICYCSSMFENAENKRRQVNLDSNAASSSSRRSTTPLDVPPPRQSHLDSQDMRRYENNGESSTVAQLYNSSTVVGAVRRFVNDVYCPFLLSAQMRMGNTSPNVYRIQLSTLLAIREMLLMNADKLFTFSTLDQSSSKYSSERKYLSFVFANAIVKNAARRLPSRDRDQDQVYSDFLQATRRYDSKSEDFQFALTRTDVLEVSEYRNGIQVGKQERSLHKIGFNYARSRHPLLATTETEGDGTGGGRMYGSTLPEPTACAAIYIETSTDAVDAEDTATLESFKRVLRKPPPSKRSSSECIDLT